MGCIRRAAEQFHQCVIHQLNHHLRWADASDDFRADHAFLQAADEIPCDGQGDIRLQQGYAHVAQRRFHIRFGERAFAAEFIQRFGQAFGEVFEHS